ncbi:MAG: glycosyltransferase [Deltaproteobacteria bacterium]|nr:glycosyltransferase [Deltaproteobacteria bacterium]
MMDQPLRFCMVTTFYPPYNFGGDGIFVHHLSNELARRGHHVEVVHCIDAYRFLAGKEPAQSYNDHPNVITHGLRSPFGFISPAATQQTGFPWFKSRRLRQILAQGFDVIHYHNMSLLGASVLKYARGVKLYTAHEYWLVCPTHVLFKFNREPCARPSCLSCSIVYKRPPQWWRYFSLLDGAAKSVDAFLVPSRFSMDKHREFGFSGRMVHMPYFISPTESVSPISSPAVREPLDKNYFLFVGRLEKLKGVQTLIPLFRRYDKAQLWIAGTGNHENRLRQLADGSSNIRFLGHLSQAELQPLYRNAVAVLVPSLWFEVFGLIIIEGFSQRTPAVVRNLGGMAEIIKESGGGFVYDTEEELVAVMDRLVADPSCRRDLGLRGYEAYRQNWTAEAHLERYFELIRERQGAGSREQGEKRTRRR